MTSRRYVWYQSTNGRYNLLGFSLSNIPSISKGTLEYRVGTLTNPRLDGLYRATSDQGGALGDFFLNSLTIRDSDYHTEHKCGALIH